MTLSVAWLRDVGTHPEMVFASDSRLNQGGTWDAGPKVIRLARSDALVSFAGETLWAYPFLIHASNAVHAFRPWRERHRDLREVPRRLRDVMNGLVDQGETFKAGYNKPLTELMLGGWSWQAQDFLLWRLHWSEAQSAFEHETIPRRAFGKCCFIGDRSEEDENLDVVPFARQRLREILHEREKPDGPLNMEPFEVLVEIIREERFRSVGGAPQLAKIYRHMNTQFFAVAWPDSDGTLTYGGRKLLAYEEFGLPEIDPDQPAIHARTSRGPLRARRSAQIREVLLGTVESMGRAAFEEVARSVADHGLNVTDDQIRGIVEIAIAAGELVELDDGVLGWPDESQVPEADEAEL